MTCVVSLIEDGAVWMGADSAGANSAFELTVRRDPKIFHNGPFLIGYTTSFRMGQLLRFNLDGAKVGQKCAGKEAFEAMVRVFIPAVRQVLGKGGFRKKNHDVEEGGTFLVAYRGRVFTIENDFQVGEAVAPIAACGCAQDLALGALHALGETCLSPKQKIRRTLEIAEQWSAGVCRPFHILKLRGI